MYYIGIDVGNTNARIAVAKDGGEIKCLDVEGNGTFALPCVVHYGSYEPIVGYKASVLSCSDKGHVIPGGMGFINTGKVWHIGSMDVTPEDILTVIFKRLIGAFEKEFPNEPYRCGISCPIEWENRERILDIAMRAGIDGPKLVPPIEAIVDRVRSTGGYDKVVVVDIGGTSTRVISSAKRGSIVWCNERVGGCLWDRIVRNLVYARIHEQLTIPISHLKDDVAVRTSVETALPRYKAILNSGDVHELLELRTSRSRLFVGIDITKAEYERECCPLFDLILGELRNVRGKPTFVLVGGGCNTSCIQSGMRSEFFRTICDSPDSYLVQSVVDYIRRLPA